MADVQDLHVVHVSEAMGGGLLGVVKALVGGHLGAGFRVSVVSGRRPETPAQLTEEFPSGVDLVEIEGWGRRTASGELAATRQVRRTLKRLRPDVCVFHSSFAGMAGVYAKGIAPTVFAPHAFVSQLPGSRLKAKSVELGERTACRLHTRVACVSRSEGQVAARLGARQPVVIPNGLAALDDPEWTAAPRRPTRPLVVALGRLVPQRQPLQAAEILRGVADIADVKWVGGGGSGAYADSARQALEDAGVEVTGWLPRREVDELLGRATVYLHWTSWDGLPMSVLEAMAADAVVVASDPAPNVEVLGRDGVVDSPSAAIERIRELLHDATAWGERALRQRTLAEPYSEQQMTRSWNDLLSDLGGRANREQNGFHDA